MPYIGLNTVIIPSFYAPSLSVKRFAVGRYGVGHTNRRQPGDTRGTVVGREGRFKGPDAREEVVSRA